MYNKIEQKVPDNIRYLSDWKDYRLPDGHCIVDKEICGCGYTEYCIRLDNPYDTILCSPRIILLENKMEKHPGEPNIFYFSNEGLKKIYQDTVDKKDKDLTAHNKKYMNFLAGTVRGHVLTCRTMGLPVRILCTYDSFHTIYEILQESINQYHVIVDEFSSIFVDSFFKADVENGFLTTLSKKDPFTGDYLIQNVIYLSATPMMDKYLEKIPEFRNLPFYHMAWPNARITKATVLEKWVDNVYKEILNIINIYKNKPLDRPWKEVNGMPVYSNEVVFFVNSVSMICKIIKKAKLDPSECNIICAPGERNTKILNKINHKRGRIPLEGEPHKMFTFCTRTTYLGADFYSTSAITVVASDAKVESMIVDVRLDLPQILGRQRLEINPWKNEAFVFYSTVSKDGHKTLSKEDLDHQKKKKYAMSNKFINLFNGFVTREEKEDLLDILFPHRNKPSTTDPDSGVRKCYLGIDYKGNLVINDLLVIAEERAWELLQKDYINNITVVRSIADNRNINVVGLQTIDDERVQTVIDQIKALPRIDYKFKLYCEVREKFKDDQNFTDKLLSYYIGTDFENFYSHFGIDKCRAVSYQFMNLKRMLFDETNADPLRNMILNTFKLKEKYTLKEIKETLGKIYNNLGLLSKTPKASDIKEYFNTKQASFYDKVTGKRDNGFKLVSIK